MTRERHGETIEQGEIAVGVPMFSRTVALENFLASVPDYVSTAYVADNGRESYDIEDCAVDVEVLDLEYDSGIGACRAAIVDACTEPYLWMGDNDMEFCRRSDLRRLRSILDANPELGGVAGWLIEGDTVRAGARNLRQTASGYAVKVADDIEMQTAPLPYATFDFVPQAALFRTEVFEDYSYDPSVGSSEHFDFFWGHKQVSAWKWASTPTVMTLHHREIDEEYRETERGRDHVSLDRIEEKWGVGDIVPGPNIDWAQVRDVGLLDDAFDVFKRVAPPRIWVPLKRTGEAILR